MRVLPITNNNCYATKKEQNPNFKTKFVDNTTLRRTVAHAEKQSCRRFLGAVKNLLNDKMDRVIELSGERCVSKDGILYTKTTLTCDGKKSEYAGFPHIYGTTPNEMIANDGRLLLIDFAQGYNCNEFLPLSKEEVQKKYKEVKKQLFK